MPRSFEQLPRDPMPALLAHENRALNYFVQRDILNKSVPSVERLWELPEPHKLVRQQQSDGSWRYPGRNRARFPETNYDLLQTFKSLGTLVQKYGFDRRHPAITRAAEYVFSCQTKEGDIRGILGSQYMPYYHGLLVDLLIAAGYADDSRIHRALDWLVAVRQDDGGWIVPTQAVPAREQTRELWSAPPIPPDRSLPASHLATGMALRPLVTHPAYREREETRRAAQLLKSRLLQADAYGARKAPSYWTKFQYPFWWTNLVTALDLLSLLGFSAGEPQIRDSLAWFVAHQEDNGLWRTGYEQAKRAQPTFKEADTMAWVGLAVCRILKRLS
ncbi:MAG: prenyltransferase/squalene oxidase repeat-containing protein [Anaerolineae bacterium]